MCSYITHSTPVLGTAYAHGEWIDVNKTVVSFDHPHSIPLDHALSIDFRSDDPTRRVAVELDPESARQLAYTILTALAP